MHPIASYARTAYAHGVAISGGPVTDRVKAGCIAAVELAIRHADDPDVLEATLQLGALEGTWAAIYDRREKLHTDNEQRIAAAWQALNLRHLAGVLVAAGRRKAGLVEAANQDEWLTDLIRQTIAANVTVAGWNGLLEAIQSSILSAQAEGNVAAQALRVEDLAAVGFSFDIAFEDAYKALENISSLAVSAEADAWLNQLLGGNADAIGARLSAMTRAGDSYEDMVADVGGLLDGADAIPIRTAVDVLTSRALSRGALDLYRADGLQYADYITAGDQRVCPRCSALEKGNPYRLEDAPLSGQHPWCRCAIAPAEHPANAGVSALAQQLAGAEQPPLADRVGSGVIASRQLGGGASAATSLVTFADGSQAVEKVAKAMAEVPAKEATDGEYLAAQLGRALGVPVPEVVRTAVDTVYAEYVKGAQTGLELFDGIPAAEADQKLEALVDSVAGRRIGLFDLVTANMDRNDGNWLIDASDNLWAIDHGVSFQAFPTTGETMAMVGMGNPFAGALLDMERLASGWEVTGGSRAYSAADIDRVRSELTGLESEFRAARRMTWYRQTMSRLNWLARYADGDGTLFE